MKTINVNAREHQVDLDEISYQQVAVLAFGDKARSDVVYTVTYNRDRHDSGHDMIRGNIVPVTEGMLFSISLTNNA
jgi:hypothetical protein